VTVLAGHPAPEVGRVRDVERFPQRLGLHVRETGGAMDRRCLFGAAEATEGARVVGALVADDRGGGGAGEREPRVLVDGRPQCGDAPAPRRSPRPPTGGRTC
jgi:hypothetical protein